MSAIYFPTLSIGMNSKVFSSEAENPVVRTKMEGGYVTSRPRHTRRPRRTYTVGFTFLSEADRIALETFWDTVKGGSVAFYWTHPTTGVERLMRFAEGESLSFKHIGVGSNLRWETQFKLEEV